MRALWLLLGLSVAGIRSAPAAAQFRAEPVGGPRLTNPSVQQWRIGVVVTAGSGPLRGVTATTSAPMDWPEQQVRIVGEDVSPGARIEYRVIDEAVKQMALRIPALAPGRQARGIVTFEVTRSWQEPPDNTDRYVLPDPRRLDRRLRAFLEPSPYIESNSTQIQALARQIGAGEKTAWARVEAIYDWVRQNIRFVDDRARPPRGTAHTLATRTGDCDELTSLFIAICRAANIPARTVRVPGHCYPEFYLEDGRGRGYWFPCQAGGTRAFGGVPEHRPILQKGDNLLVSQAGSRRKTRYRFLPSSLVTAVPPRGGTPPRLETVLEPVTSSTHGPASPAGTMSDLEPHPSLLTVFGRASGEPE